MRKVWILTLVFSLSAIFLLGGCLTVRDHGQIIGAMPKEERDKFADQVACKVVEKLKKECPCPQKACTKAIEPNQAGK